MGIMLHKSVKYYVIKKNRFSFHMTVKASINTLFRLAFHINTVTNEWLEDTKGVY